MAKLLAYADSTLALLPGTLQVRLYTAAPTLTSNGTEVSGGSYAPVTITLGSVATVGQVRRRTATADAVFPTATASWGTVVASAITGTDGTIWQYQSSTTTPAFVSQAVASGVTPTIPAASLYIQEGLSVLAPAIGAGIWSLPQPRVGGGYPPGTLLVTARNHGEGRMLTNPVYNRSFDGRFLGEGDIDMLPVYAANMTSQQVGQGAMVSDVSAAFDPSQLGTTKLIAWYDFGDLSTIWANTAGTTPTTNNGKIARINDKSGNGWNLTQATSGYQPTRTDSIFNGLAAANSTGAAYMPSANGIINGLNKVMCWCVFRTNTSSLSTLYEFGPYPSAYINAYVYTDSNMYVGCANPANSNLNERKFGVVDYTTVHLVEMTYDFTLSSPQVTFTLDGSVITGTQTSANLSSGTYGNLPMNLFSRAGANAMNGRIGSLMVTQILTGSDRTNLRAWLKARFGTP